MTRELFRFDSYVKQCSASVLAIYNRAVHLDQTVLFVQGGGQAGDSGTMTWYDSNRKLQTCAIINTLKDNSSGQIWHVTAAEQPLPPVGSIVELHVEWSLRYARMKMHTSLHLLCAIIPCGVTGGQIGEKKSRLDFDTSDSDFILDSEDIDTKLEIFIAAHLPITYSWVDESVLQQRPDIVRTMSVKPPKQAGGKLRLVQIGSTDQIVDLQPCGGTHVANTSEIGTVSVSKIENKGARNKRVHILLD